VQVPPGHFPPPPPGPSPYVDPDAGGESPSQVADQQFEGRNTPVAAPSTADPFSPRGEQTPLTPQVAASPQLPTAPYAAASPPLPPLPTPPPAQTPGSPVAPSPGLPPVEPLPDPVEPLPVPPMALGSMLERPEPSGPISVSATSKIKPPRRGRALVAALAIALLLGVATLAAHLVTRPWLARPEDGAKKLERRFREVRQWAHAPRRGTRKEDVLIGAAHLAASWVPKPGGGELPQLDEKKLAKQYQEAIDGLAKWTRAQGGFSSAGCLTPTGERFVAPAASASALSSVGASAPASASAIPSSAAASREEKDAANELPAAQAYYRLGRLTLESTKKSRRLPVRVRGVLKLSYLMRAQGNLDEYVAGLRLTRDAAQWMKSRKQNHDPSFDRYRPRPTQLRAMLARGAVCSLAQVEGLDGWHFDVGKRFPGASHGPPLGFVSYEREALVLQDFHSRLLHETRDAREASELVDAYLSAERPRSAVLEVTLPSPAVLKEMADLCAEYDKLVPTTSKRTVRSNAAHSRTQRSRPKPSRPVAP